MSSMEGSSLLIRTSPFPILSASAFGFAFPFGFSFPFLFAALLWKRGFMYSGSGLLSFSGLMLPVGNLVRIAAASIWSSSQSSSTLSYSGLDSLLRHCGGSPPYPSKLSPLRQKPLLRSPFPRRLQAGGL